MIFAFSRELRPKLNLVSAYSVLLQNGLHIFEIFGKVIFVAEMLLVKVFRNFAVATLQLQIQICCFKLNIFRVV